jgi:hypothetical protein
MSVRAAAVAVAVVVVVGFSAGSPRVAAAQGEPKGAHPRLFLTPEIRAQWKQEMKKAGPIKTAIQTCGKAASGGYDRDLYMGFQWATAVQACLIAWAATDDDDHAKVAIRYFTAMLDDVQNVGDGKGGDGTVRRDSGYAIRLIGPMSALTYDWLHDHKLMTPALKQKALGRFKAWLDWYIKNGYRPRSPGTNYHAGYLVSATLISIAQGGDAGAYGGELWKHVLNDLWKGDMVKAFTKGPLAGGDWGEGWQYAPLSLTGYALAARAMTAQGVELDGLKEWLTALVVRHVHGMSPGGQTFVGGDVENETPNIDLNGMTMIAVLVGDTPPEPRAWAASELDQLKLNINEEFRIYDALAYTTPVKPVPVPRKDWPTWYLARGTGNLYARTHWGRDAMWTVMQCTSTIDIDHFHPDAGNFVLSRGPDDVIVDPSPYGTLSSMSSNAPTVESAHLPEHYKPGQAFWSSKTRWEWAHQTKAGVVVGRCNYADQYKFQDRPSDVPAALRDLVMIPWNDGRDGTMVVIDRAKSGDKARDLFLRFRTTGGLALKGDTATTTVGSTALAIQKLAASSGKPEIKASTVKDCFGNTTTRGNCDAARFPVTDMRIVVDGPEMSAVHVIDATGKGGAPKATLQSGTGWQAAWLEGKDGAAMVVYGSAGGKSLTYQAEAKAAMHVVVDAPADSKGKSTIAATAKDGGCAVTIKAGGDAVGRPAVFALDDKCAVTDDAIMTGGTKLGATAAAVGGGSDGADPLADGGDGSGGASTVGGGDSGTGDGTGDGTGGPGAYPDNGEKASRYGPRTGCCGAQSTPASPVALSGVVLLALFGLRRRR